MSPQDQGTPLLTKKELAAVRKRVEALAEPLSLLALMELFRTRDDQRVAR